MEGDPLRPRETEDTKIDRNTFKADLISIALIVAAIGLSVKVIKLVQSALLAYLDLSPMNVAPASAPSVGLEAPAMQF